MTFDKRFSLVTATLAKAVHDIVPLLVILGSVLFTYSVLGCVIYGQSLEDFSSAGASMSSLLVIMLGEVNIYDQSELYLALKTFFRPLIFIVFYCIVLLSQ